MKRGILHNKRAGLSTISFILSLLLLLCSGGFCYGQTIDVLQTVVIDAGHGGIDGGTVGVTTGVKEADLNLAIAQKLQARLERAGYRVVMTRSDENGLYGDTSPGYKRRDMQERKRIIEQAAPQLVISIHLNRYAGRGRSGAQVFYCKEREDSALAARCLQRQFNENLNRRPLEALAGDFFMVHCTPYTSVIAECGFLSNPEEERLLQTQEYQEKLAELLWKGAIAFFMESDGVGRSQNAE